MERNVIYRDRVDHKILFTMVSLIAFGLVMIYSVASAQENLKLFYKQAACMIVGFTLVFFLRRIKMNYLLFKMAIPTYLLGYILIFMLRLPEPVTVTVNGATRWLKVGPVNFQVAEFVKLAVILMLAGWAEYARYRRGLAEELGFILGGWVMGTIPAALLMFISNDLSSSLVVMGITFIMTFVSSRGKLSWIMHILAVLMVAGLVAASIYYVSQHMPTEAQVQANEVSFRLGRIAAWLHPERYVNTIAYQSVHCLYAIANGGWFGKGLGQSWQKASLPESENDVIFAIIIEELGIFGGLVLIFLFIVLVTLICKVAFNTKNLFDRMVCTGVASHIMLQVIIHCGVCTNLIPNTGIGLPFISSGLTATLFQLAEMTIVLSAASVHIFNRYNRKLQRDRKRRKEEKQRFFMGRKVRLAEARMEAMDRYSVIADEDMKKKSSRVAKRRKNRAITMGNRPGKKGQAASGKEQPPEKRTGSTIRSRTGSGSRYGSSVSRPYTRSGSSYGSRTNRPYTGNRSRYGSSTNRSYTGTGSRYGSSTNRPGMGTGSRVNRPNTGTGSRYGVDADRYSAYRRNQRKAPTSIYSWKYEKEKDRSSSTGRKPDPDKRR